MVVSRQSSALSSEQARRPWLRLALSYCCAGSEAVAKGCAAKWTSRTFSACDEKKQSESTTRSGIQPCSKAICRENKGVNLPLDVAVR